jgi:surface protein
LTTLASLFSSRPTFNSDISGWNTASATSLSQMFYGATAFNQNIARWNVARVRDL